MKKFKFNKILIIVLTITFVFGAVGIVKAWIVYTNPAPVNLGTASSFAILAGSGITNSTSPTTITGDIGTFATTSETGFTGSDTITGTDHAGDSVTQLAKTHLTTAYNNAAARSPDFTLASAELGGWILGPGVYNSAPGDLQITTAAGSLTLDGGGNPNAVFIFKAASTLKTMTDNSVVSLINGAQACNVFWQVGTSATLGTHSTFKGTIMADQSITDNGGSNVVGRLLASVAHVTVSNTTLTVPTCVPSLLLQKAIAGGGPDLNTAWTLTATGTATNLSGITGTTGANSDLQFPNATFQAGTYTLAETGPSTNYVATYSCANVNNGVTTTTTSSSITLVAGDKATCIITNTYTAPATLTLVKTISGGTRTVSDFPLTATGPTTITGISGAGSITSATVTAGVYTLSETTQSNYTAGTWSCTNGITVNGSNQITLSGGNTTICTIINTYIPPAPATLILTKTVINIGGGAKILDDFQAKIDGVSVPWFTPQTLSAGLHTASEVNLPNYTASVWGGECATNGTITLVPGVNTCTITNTYVAPVSSGGGGSYTPSVPPLIDVVKVPSPLVLPAGPGLVKYIYTLRNIGTVPVTNITMVGDTCSPIILTSGDTNADSKLDVTETWVYNCSTTLSKTHTNIVTATGWANGISTTDIASATVVVGAPIIPPLIHVTKVPSPLALLTGAGTVTYKYTVTNPGTVPLSNVSIVDDKCTGLPGRVVGHPGDLNKNNLLESNESWSFTCKSNIFETTTNTATASGSANGLTAKDFAIATVVVTNVPGLPKTGFGPENNIPWNIIIPAGILGILISFYFTRKK